MDESAFLRITPEEFIRASAAGVSTHRRMKSKTCDKSGDDWRICCAWFETHPTATMAEGLKELGPKLSKQHRNQQWYEETTVRKAYEKILGTVESKAAETAQPLAGPPREALSSAVAASSNVPAVLAHPPGSFIPFVDVDSVLDAKLAERFPRREPKLLKCSSCQSEKPSTAFSGRQQGVTDDDRMCKVCLPADPREMHRLIEKRTCAQCHTEKDRLEFAPSQANMASKAKCMTCVANNLASQKKTRSTMQWTVSACTFAHPIQQDAATEEG